jgi:tetratricopeptide (TPR) repeat protein
MRGLSRISSVLVVWLLAVADPAGAAVTAHATLDRASTSVGQAVELTVALRGTQQSEAPSLETPDGLQVDYRGQSTQVEIVNGRMDTSVSHVFSVLPMRAGTYVLGPVRVRYPGGQASTDRVRLVVTSGPAAADGTATQGLRLVAHVPKTRLYLHERVPLSVRLEVGNVQVTDVQYPVVPSEGLARADFAEPTQRQERRGRGVVQVVDFPTNVVPLRAGTLTIGPVELQLSVVGQRRRRGFFDSLFAERTPTTLRAEPIALTVLPLPESGRPADFSGAVGQLTLEVDASPRDVAAGDPVTVTTRVRGTGNLDGMRPPVVAPLGALKIYEPTEEAVPDQTPPIRERRFEQVVIPPDAGVVTLPPISIAYFDPTSESYRRAVGAPLVLTVRPGAERARDVVVGAAPPPDATPETIGRDLVFIKDDPGFLRPRGDRRQRRLSVWAAPVVPRLAWLGPLGWDRRRRRLSEDPSYARFVVAGDEAVRRFAAAEEALAAGCTADGLDTLARAVHDYLAAKLSLAPGEVTAERARGRLEAAGVAPAQAEEARALLHDCEQVRFRPAAGGDAAALLERARRLVRSLERTRRLTAPLVAVLVAVAGLGAVAAAPETPRSIFARGNTSFADGDFAAAAAQYQRVLTGGLESGPLYYNLGNAYLRAGDVGRAVLNYERARRLMPGDADLEANLRFATNGGDPDEGRSLLARLAVPLAARLSTDTLLLVLGVSWWLIAGALCIGRLWPPSARVVPVVAMALGVVVGLTGSAAAYRVATVDEPAWAVVIGDAAVRFAPTTDGTVHYEAPTGTMVRVLAARADWLQVARRSDGLRGWVPAPGVERL